MLKMLAFYRLLEVTREINSQYLFLRIEQWCSVHQINITQFSLEEKEQFSEYEFSKSKQIEVLWFFRNYLQSTIYKIQLSLNKLRDPFFSKFMLIQDKQVIDKVWLKKTLCRFYLRGMAVNTQPQHIIIK